MKHKKLLFLLVYVVFFVDLHAGGYITTYLKNGIKRPFGMSDQEAAEIGSLSVGEARARIKEFRVPQIRLGKINALAFKQNITIDEAAKIVDSSDSSNQAQKLSATAEHLNTETEYLFDTEYCCSSFTPFYRCYNQSFVDELRKSNEDFQKLMALLFPTSESGRAESKGMAIKKQEDVDA